VGPVEVLVRDRVGVLEVADDLDLAALRERPLEGLSLLARDLDPDPQRLGEELAELVALVLELGPHALAGLLREGGPLRDEARAQLLPERRLAELGAPAAEADVHLPLEAGDRLV